MEGKTLEQRMEIINKNYTFEQTMEMVEEIRNSNGTFDENSLVRDVIVRFYLEEGTSPSMFLLKLIGLIQDLMFIMNQYVKNKSCE